MTTVALPPDLQDVDTMFDFTAGSLLPSSGGHKLGFELHVDHAFRHAKELKNATHGGYNQGWLELPSSNSDLIVELSTLPSAKSEQPLQPNMLHVTIMDMATRKAVWKLEMEPQHWRLRLRVRGDQAFLLKRDPETGEETEWGDPVNPFKIVQGGEDGSSRRLLFGDNGLLVTIITPLQSQSRSSGIRITDVFQDRLAHDAAAAGETRTVEQLANAFTNRKVNKFARIEMHRCRLRAKVMDGVTGESLGTAVSKDINNTKNNDVGAINLLEMSDPRSSCTEGGFKVLLSSEFRAPTLKGSEPPVRVLFVIERNGRVHLAEEIYTDFKQISLEHFQIYQNSTLAFIVPAQTVNCIKRLQRTGDTLKLALFRPHDRMFSAKKFRFDYIPHETGECAFCAIMGRGQQPVKTLERKKRARKDERVRRTVHRESESSSTVFSPPPTVSSSSGFSSHDDPFSPANKIQRMSESEFSPPGIYMQQQQQEQQQQMQQQMQQITMQPNEVPLPVAAAYPDFTLSSQDPMNIISEAAEVAGIPLSDSAVADLATLDTAQPMEDILNTDDFCALLDSVENGMQDSKRKKKQFSGFDKLDFGSDEEKEEESEKPEKFLGCKDGFKVTDKKIQHDGLRVTADKSTDMDGLCDQIEKIQIVEEKSKRKSGFFGFLAKLGFGKKKKNKAVVADE